MDELCDMLIYSFKRSYQEKKKKKVGMNLELSFLNSESEVKNYRMRGCTMEATGLWFTTGEESAWGATLDYYINVLRYWDCTCYYSETWATLISAKVAYTFLVSIILKVNISNGHSFLTHPSILPQASDDWK